jgi:hypothetical protein
MEPVKKMREVFVLHPIMEKNLSRFFKIHFHLPRIASQDEVKLVKMLRKRFLFRKVVFRTPPEVVSGFRGGGGGGGGGGPWPMELTPIQGWFYNTTSFQTPPPPTVKGRTVEGVQNRL